MSRGRVADRSRALASATVRLAVLVAFSAFAVYMASFRTIQSIDSNTNAFVAYSLVRDGDPYLDEFAATYGQLSFWSFPVNGHRISPYPPGAAFLGLPFAIAGTLLGITPPQADAITIVAKAAGAAAAAASVGFVFLLAARTAGRRLGLLVAGLYAFGTVTWPISGGALWQHGPAQLFLAVALLWLVTPAWSARSGLVFGLATLSRLTSGLFAAAALGYVVVARRSILPRLVGWALIPAVALVAYNVVTFGDPLDLRYFSFNYTKPGGSNLLAGVAGNLVAPNRGLLVYSPFLALAVYELARRSLRRDRIAILVRSQLIAAAGVLVVYGASVDWWGGYGYGPRYLAEALPLLAFGLALWLRRNRTRPLARFALIATAVPAVVVASLGALVYDWQSWSWERLHAIPEADLQWSLDPPQILYTAAHASERFDAVTAISLVVIAAVAVLWWRMWSNAGRRAAVVTVRVAAVSGRTPSSQQG